MTERTPVDIAIGELTAQMSPFVTAVIDAYDVGLDDPDTTHEHIVEACGTLDWACGNITQLAKQILSCIPDER